MARDRQGSRDKTEWNDDIRRILTLLAERGWSKAELARRAGVTTSTICNMLRRNTRPGMETLEKYCDAFGISVGEFSRTSTRHRPDFYVLSEDERILIDRYRMVPEDRRAFLLRQFIAIHEYLRGER